MFTKLFIHGDVLVRDNIKLNLMLQNGDYAWTKSLRHTELGHMKLYHCFQPAVRKCDCFEGLLRSYYFTFLVYKSVKMQQQTLSIIKNISVFYKLLSLIKFYSPQLDFLTFSARRVLILDFGQ